MVETEYLHRVVELAPSGFDDRECRLMTGPDEVVIVQGPEHHASQAFGVRVRCL